MWFVLSVFKWVVMISAASTFRKSYILFLLLLTFFGLQFKLQDVQEDTVSKECEDDEVDGEGHAAANASLRFNPVVHDSIPVLTRQNLRKTKESEQCRGHWRDGKDCANLRLSVELNYFTE